MGQQLTACAACTGYAVVCGCQTTCNTVKGTIKCLTCQPKNACHACSEHEHLLSKTPNRDQCAKLISKNNVNHKVPNINKKTSQFKDDGFPTSKKSLETQSSQANDNCTWKRSKEFLDNPQLYSNDINPSDVEQGMLGDCYFLCSLAALAQYPSLIKNCILHSDIENGHFVVRFFENLNEPKIVEIDDFFPILNSGNDKNKPAFTRSKENELWVLVLEKAFAKLHGSYGKIEGGFPSYALNKLTGVPAVRYDLDTLDYDETWKLLMNAAKKKWIVAAGTHKHYFVPCLPSCGCGTLCSCCINESSEKCQLYSPKSFWCIKLTHICLYKWMQCFCCCGVCTVYNTCT